MDQNIAKLGLNEKNYVFGLKFASQARDWLARVLEVDFYPSYNKAFRDRFGYFVEFYNTNAAFNVSVTFLLKVETS